MGGQHRPRDRRGRRNGRPLAFLLSALLLLSACQPGSRDYQIPEPEQLTLSGKEGQTVTVFLHYYDESGNEKVAPISLWMAQGESRALLAARSLFQSTEEADWQSVPEDWEPLFVASERNVYVEEVAVSGNTANVSLRTRDGGSVDLSTRVKTRVYLANTLIDTLPEVEYVNVFYNGKPLKYNNMALGAMGRYDGSPEEYLEELKRRSDQTYPMTINATLYFPHEDGKYLVCETRPVEMTDGLGRGVMAALMQGPSTSGLRPVTSGGIVSAEDSFQMSETLGAARDGEQTPEEQGVYADGEEGWEAPNGEEEGPDEEEPDGETGEETEILAEGSAFGLYEQLLNIRVQGEAVYPELSRAAIVCTMLTLQDNDGVSVYFPQQGFGSEEAYFSRDDFAGYLGNWMPVYAWTNGEFLVQGNGIGDHSLAAQAETRLAALWENAGDPVSEDVTTYPVFSAKWKAEWLRDVIVAEEMIVVDLDSACLDHWKGLFPKELRLEIYAIVNTLTEVYGVNAVQILLDGETVEQVGDMALLSPLLANPGLVQP